MVESELKPPRAFISYSWTSPDHEQWVHDLATRLRESGIDAVMDKWDLREGADKFAFMERMVTDPSIDKVIVVCDQLYAEKADGRAGGVGTETTIISQEIYNQIDSTSQVQKFVAVITEKDDMGQAYVPTFLKSRIYIDMSDAARYGEGFEQLLRWLFGKPLYQKPPLGSPPSFIIEDTHPTLATTAAHRLAVGALRQQKSSAPSAVTDYFGTLASNLESYRLLHEKDKEFDEQVLESIDGFLPYRNEAIDVFLSIARYFPSLDGYQAMHRFFEQVLPYGFWPPGRSSWRDYEVDNLRFMTRELFLYAITALIKHDRFDGVRELTEQEYFISAGSPDFQREAVMVPFLLLDHGIHALSSFRRRNQRLGLQRLSLSADLLKTRATLPVLGFDDLMQADLLLFLRADLNPVDERWSRKRWLPETLVYASRHHGPFEVFARAKSRRYFDQLKIALGISDKDALVALVERYMKQELPIPKWQFDSFSPSGLIKLEDLATRP
jgi:hypothetical protein